uniref:Envelope glycoprotein n=1 Tax=Molossus molossus TaxID=27622 RepID=A0A7J8GRF7_MOLMO|nr:hypothetical protein HJG59_011281 [Molossus molossus]
MQPITPSPRDKESPDSRRATSPGASPHLHSIGADENQNTQDALIGSSTISHYNSAIHLSDSVLAPGCPLILATFSPSLLESSHLFRTLNLTQCLLYKANSTFAPDCWVCLSLSSSAYSAICVGPPPICVFHNWTGTCTLVYLTPNINIVPQDASLPVPNVTLINTRRHKRAIQLVPLLTALSSTGALGLGAGGLGTSLSYFHILSEDLQNSLEEIASTLLSIQDQLDSLTAVTLQNRRGLDFLTAEKGGICIFLEEQCCFYLNQSGLVRNAANNLKEKAQRIWERRDQSWSTWFNSN